MNAIDPYDKPKYLVTSREEEAIENVVLKVEKAALLIEVVAERLRGRDDFHSKRLLALVLLVEEQLMEAEDEECALHPFYERVNAVRRAEEVRFRNRKHRKLTVVPADASAAGGGR